MQKAHEGRPVKKLKSNVFVRTKELEIQKRKLEKKKTNNLFEKIIENMFPN